MLMCLFDTSSFYEDFRNHSDLIWANQSLEEISLKVMLTSLSQFFQILQYKVNFFSMHTHKLLKKN